MPLREQHHHELVSLGSAMFVGDLILHFDGSLPPEGAVDKVHGILGALRLNGQIVGREFPIAVQKNSLSVRAIIPEATSLDDSNHNAYVRSAIRQAQAHRLRFAPTVAGSVGDTAPICDCNARTGLILYTTYINMEPPLRCGDCFKAVPLYHIPLPQQGEFIDIITWESDYKACDTLQMNTATGERFALRQMSRLDSSLSKRALEICARIARDTNVPTYYHLHHERARSHRAETQRLCPSCNGAWLLDRPWHTLFAFRCDKCRLVSNLAYSLG